MKKLLLILIFISATCRAGDLQLSDGDRIAFAGDSNMTQWRWVHYVASYLVLMNPTLKLHIWCAARSGTYVGQWLDDPTGYNGYDEYSKNDYAMQPRYVFAMLGVNGGEAPSVFGPKMESLVSNYVVSQNATPIVFGPICGITTTGNTNLRDKDDAVTAFCAIHGWTNVRTWHDLSPIWTNPLNFTRLLDSITIGHASAAGHIQEAYLIIKDLGWSKTVSNATINASTGTVTSSDHCTISGLMSNAYNGVDFNRLDARLPWAIDETGYDGNARQMATDMLPELAGWLDYSITITDLSSGTYNIFCDDVQIGSVSNATLAIGWNMADLTSGPVFDQAQEVLGRIRDMQGVDRVTLANKNPNKGMVRWRSNGGAYYGLQGKRGAELIAAMQPAVTELNGCDDLIHSAAQPVTRHYSVRSSGPISTPTAVPVPTATATCTCPG